MPSSLQAATMPTPDCFQYSDSRSSCRLRPRRPTRTPLAYQECCDKPWNPPVLQGAFPVRAAPGDPLSCVGCEQQVELGAVEHVVVADVEVEQRERDVR